MVAEVFFAFPSSFLRCSQPGTWLFYVPLVSGSSCFVSWCRWRLWLVRQWIHICTSVYGAVRMLHHRSSCSSWDSDITDSGCYDGSTLEHGVPAVGCGTVSLMVALSSSREDLRQSMFITGVLAGTCRTKQDLAPLQLGTAPTVAQFLFTGPCTQVQGQGVVIRAESAGADGSGLPRCVASLPFTACVQGPGQTRFCYTCVRTTAASTTSTPSSYSSSLLSPSACVGVTVCVVRGCVGVCVFFEL